MPTLSGQAEDAANRTISLTVVLAILGGTIGGVFTNLGTVMQEFANVSTGNVILDSIITGGLALLVGVGIVFGIVKIAQRAGGGSD